ncbi:MAG: TIGR03560 family F420-dependent LLM class oxidoreductase [Chloroflexota bacterium]|nr:MAG: LLM class F420-dependent oxidoreductase [Chloroflexota bacterium]
MKLALQLNNYVWEGGPPRLGATLSAIAQAADEWGFSRIAVVDHLWAIPPWMGSHEDQLPECYTTLAYLAASTKRVELIALATPPHFRAPALLAKMVSTLDVLSGGRAWLGAGAGDYADEAIGLGMPYPPVAERFEMLEETVQICLRMWSGQHGDGQPFHGRHFQLQRALNTPQLPPRPDRPRPPILIAGGGEQKTLRLVARYADACNLPFGPQIPRKLDVLRRHCEAEGRDYDAIEKTCAYYFDVGEDGSKVGQLVEQLRSLAQQGIQTVFGAVPGVERITPLEVIGREVIPAVADL